MTSDDAQRILDELEASPHILFPRRLALTYRALRGLRRLIDTLDSALGDLAYQRNEALYLLGELALSDLESAHPTLDRAAFADTLGLLRADLSSLQVKAQKARTAHASAADDIATESGRLRTERDRVEALIAQVDSAVAHMADDLPDREAQLVSFAEQMVELKSKRDGLVEVEREYGEAAELTLVQLSTRARSSADAVNHVHGRVQAVIRDLGRSILASDHPLNRSDPARTVTESIDKMGEVRTERQTAIHLLDRVDSAPISQFIVFSVIAVSLIVSCVFWLY